MCLCRQRNGIHLALEVKTSFANSTPTMVLAWNPALKSLEFQLTAVIGIAERERRRNLHTKNYKAKLERLCLTRLTRRDQAVRLLDMQMLQVVNDS
jgi:hypothetical protein